jgi:dTDP-4-dehydrorhamnose 3,5-epimerase
MIFRCTRLEGARLIEPEFHRDARGFFTRTWCQEKFLAEGLDVEIAQESVSYNEKRGTVRGLHFQRSPHQETKIVRCIRGAIWDVILDLRQSSPTYLQWQGFELTAENFLALYVPKGFAHGFQTRCADSLVSYQISTPYAPHAAGGCRYDDPLFAIDWPDQVTEISARDLEWPDFISGA